MSTQVNILVVDDRPEGILAVEAVLTSSSYRLVTASSGNEALRRLLEDDFAVILMDVQMPIMNGFETAAVIKTREKSKDIPIIFMSAINQDEQYVYEGYGVGAVDYLMKPFDPYILRSKVAIFADLYRKNQLIKEQTRKLYETEVRSYSQALDRLELESLRRYQYLADSLPQIVLRLNPKGEGEYFNKTWYEYTGLVANQSMNVEWHTAIHPEDVYYFLRLQSVGSHDCEVRIRRKDGVYRWHLVRFEAEHYQSLEVISSILATATDIEDRKRDEETQTFLAKAGELLVSSLDDNNLMMDIARLSVPKLADWCSIDFVNDQGKLKTVAFLHKNEALQEKAFQLHQGYLSKYESQIGSGKALRTGETQIFEAITDDRLYEFAVDDEQLKLAKELKDNSAMFIPIISQGTVVGVMTFVLSENVRSYNQHYIKIGEELGRRVALAWENARLYQMSQQAIEVRNDFLSIASHELNTPITSLKLQLQMTQKSLATNDINLERFKRSVDSSVKQVDRLINLVQVLLDVSRIQSGKFTFAFEKLNVGEVIKDLLDRQKEILEHSNCKLNYTNVPNVFAEWDKTRIEQVILNLITNAIKYAPGKVDVAVEPRHHEVFIQVKDFGKGIPENKLRTIFERFERASASDAVSGLGLGLFIVKQIVEGHNGIIDVRSKVGEGTTFEIHLPYSAHDKIVGSELH